MSGSEKRVEELLVNYYAYRQELAVLSYRIQKCASPDYEGVIESLMYPHNQAERVDSPVNTDKVVQIAESYRSIAEREHKDDLDALLEKYVPLENELRFLDYCIQALPRMPKELLTEMFINKATWEECCDRFACCRSVLSKRRRRAILLVADMFERLKAN